MKHIFGLLALLLLAGVAAQPAQAVNIGLLPSGGSYSDTITSNGPTFTQDYNFTLDATTNGLTVLATSLGQTNSDVGVDLLEIKLYDSSNNLIASGSGAPFAFFDSFAQSGIALGAGAYLFTIFGQVTAGKSAFVSISLAANQVAPIPAAGIMLLTGLGALGGLAARRRSRQNKATLAAA
jgi:hypothetical protein